MRTFVGCAACALVVYLAAVGDLEVRVQPGAFARMGDRFVKAYHSLTMADPMDEDDNRVLPPDESHNRATRASTPLGRW